ncbi:DELLA protein RGL2 [Glycine soja]
MGSDPFSSTPFNFNEFQGGYGSIQREDVVLQGEHGFSSTMESLRGRNNLPTTSEQNQKQQHDLNFDPLMIEEFNFEPIQQPKQPLQETKEPKKNKQVLPSSLASLELLSNYGSRFKRLGKQNISDSSVQTCVGPQKLSTEEIMRLAGARYIQHSTQLCDDVCFPVHPYGFGLGVLSQEENRDIELAQFLLAAAERVGCQQFERASMLLSSHFQWNSSGDGAVQRVVFHFAQALLERIRRETGGKALAERQEKQVELLKVTAIGLQGKTELEETGKGPSIMVVLEVEAMHNSPSCVNRFIEALFFYAAFFDCIGTSMKQDHECRMRIEGILSEGIRNIVAMEDGERTVRNVKIDVWRRFFARYRMVETTFSESSLYQANLVAKKFACGNFCTVDRNGKCLIVGWKGTPIHSISVWKFL